MRIFSFLTYSSDGVSPFPSYLKLVFQPYVKLGSLLIPMLNKKLCLDGLLITHKWSRTSVAPPAFPVGDVSGKVILLNRKGFTPKACLASVLTV